MKHVRLRLLVASAFTLLVAACSQLPTPQAQPETLAPQFGKSNADIGEQVLVSKQAGAVYVMGSIDEYEDYGLRRINAHAFLRRYTSAGTLVWKKLFNATNSESLTEFTEDFGGNVIVALATSSGSGDGTSELFKYTAAGQELWRRSLDGVRIVFSINATPTGEFYVIGQNSNFRSLVRKYDQNGGLMWARQLPDKSFSGPSVTDTGGNLYTVGSGGTQYVSDTIYKFDPSGELIWTRLMPKGTADSVEVQDMVIDRDALVLLGLKTWVLQDNEYASEEESDVTVTEYGLDGKRVWNRSFGTKKPDYGISIDVDSKHNIYVVAGFYGVKSLILRKYAPSGRLLSQTMFAGDLRKGGDESRINDVVVRQADELYITGETKHNLGAGYNGGYLDAFLIRLNGEGRQVWVR